MENKGILGRIARQIRREQQARFRDFRPATFALQNRPAPRNGEEVFRRGFVILAEIKRGSPSRGWICRDLDPCRLARRYAAGGAGIISVVTEPHFFHGDPRFLSRIRKEVPLPLLRKDFILHPRQVYESYNLGADLVLLIMSLLTDGEMLELLNACRSLGLGSLVEVHSRSELERLSRLPAEVRLVGINNRDLSTFEVDIRHSLRLKPHFDRLMGGKGSGVRLISESGISGADQIRLLRERQFDGALVGEALVRSPRVEEVLIRWSK